jgi:hypothetical protein
MSSYSYWSLYDTRKGQTVDSPSPVADPFLAG